MSAPPAPRLVQIGKFYPPEWGGIETFTRNLAVGIAERGFGSEAIVFTRGAHSLEQSEGVKIDRSRAAATVFSQPISLRWLFRSIRRARRADVVLIHYPNVLAIATLPFLRKVRVATYWHSDVVGKGVLGTAVALAERYLLARSELVLTSTYSYAKSSRNLRAVGKKVEVLEIGIEDVASDKAARIPHAIATFLGQDGQLVLAVGRLVGYKGFDVLVRAAASMPATTRCVIVGTGPEEEALRRLIDALGVADRVMLAGKLSDAALHALFQTASVYALPSVERSEAYAIVQVEAMAHGVPIVATDIPGSGAPEVSGRGSTGALVPVGDAHALSEALQNVMNAPTDCYRRSARARFEAMFTVERMVENAVLLLFKRDAVRVDTEAA